MENNSKYVTVTSLWVKLDLGLPECTAAVHSVNNNNVQILKPLYIQLTIESWERRSKYNNI
jgi:hypothetical protein